MYYDIDYCCKWNIVIISSNYSLGTYLLLEKTKVTPQQINIDTDTFQCDCFGKWEAEGLTRIASNTAVKDKMNLWAIPKPIYLSRVQVF